MGVLMYQALTGVAPFASRNYNALMVEIMTQAHRPLSEALPGLDRSLAVIVEGCLVKDRNHRIASVTELAERLAAVARRLGRADDASNEGPRRRSSDRLPPVRGKVGAFDRPSSAALGAQRRRGSVSEGRVAAYAGLAGLLLGAASVYALVSLRNAGANDTAPASSVQSDTALEAVPASVPRAVQGQTTVAQRTKSTAHQ
jgi:hypothetical protein